MGHRTLFELKSLNKLFAIDPEKLARWGIVDWGYTSDMEASSYDKYSEWVQNSQHGPLKYLADHRKTPRENLKQAYPDCQSALVFLFDYTQAKKWQMKKFDSLRPASYLFAFGETDYHLVMPKILEEILEMIKESVPKLEGKVICDTSPVLERDLAYRSGLGWFGKNSMMINRSRGSYFLIGSILLNKTLPLLTAPLETDHCGHCRACVEACPTDAIDEQKRTLIAEKCISTYTIELFKDAPAPTGYSESRGEVFGCDICQEVCPWNRTPILQATPSQDLVKKCEESVVTVAFSQGVDKLIGELEELSNRGFRKKYKGTPLERTGRIGLLKNLLNLGKDM